MSKPTYITLENRAVIALKGEDAKTFLQGIITADAKKLSPEHPLYALMLTPQGKFLFDMFIAEASEGSLLLDIDASRKDEFLKRIMMYKLRSKVDVADTTELAVYAILGAAPTTSDNGLIFADPRNSKLGHRAILLRHSAEAFFEKSDVGKASPEEYARARITLNVADSTDMIPDKSFPLQFRMDEIGAIDFEKGCYVGQEVTARTKHRGSVRRLSYAVKGNAALPEKGTPILQQGKQVGEIFSTCGTLGIAHIESEVLENSGGNALEANGVALKAI